MELPITFLDPSHLWQFPSSYRDYSNVVASYSSVTHGERCILLGTVATAPQRKSHPPRLQFTITDRTGHLAQVAIFGAEGDIPLLAGNQIAIEGKVSEFRGQLSISGSIAPRSHIGRVVPIYSSSAQQALDGAKLHSYATTAAKWAAAMVPTEKLSRLLECRPEFAIAQLADLLCKVHAPETIYDSMRARELLDTVAAGAVINAMLSREHRKATFVLHGESAEMDLNYLADGLPFKLTDEQIAACRASIQDMSSGVAMHRLLMGGVGSGKTACYGLVAAVAALQGAAVGILCPTQVLAQQVASEIRSYWPEVEVQEVKAVDRRKMTPWPRMVFVGTTALLNHFDGDLDLVITDEQHKFNITQRTKMAAISGHLLEVSATLIPRSMALATFGALDVSEIRKMHSDRTLNTFMIHPEQKAALFRKIRASVESGEKLLVICAKKGEDPAFAKQAVRSAANLWEKHFPGMVQTLDGDMTPDQKLVAKQAIQDGVKPILISTTVVEVGVTIPGLRIMIILDPDRYGLTQLHQLRGRLARQGGTGYCFLYKEEGVSVEAAERLELFCRTTDDFEIAKADLMLRGAGDLLGGIEQHGGTPSPIYPKGQFCDFAALSQAARKLAA